MTKLTTPRHLNHPTSQHYSDVSTPQRLNKSTILITGACGFIGSHVARLFVNKYPDYLIINLDKLTYAGNPENVSDLDEKPNYRFIHGDICDRALLENIFRKYNITHV